jgi:hypothetical protein
LGRAKKVSGRKSVIGTFITVEDLIFQTAGRFIPGGMSRLYNTLNKTIYA